MVEISSTLLVEISRRGAVVFIRAQATNMSHAMHYGDTRFKSEWVRLSNDGMHITDTHIKQYAVNIGFILNVRGKGVHVQAQNPNYITLSNVR